jgi:hypothetical protein
MSKPRVGYSELCSCSEERKDRGSIAAAEPTAMPDILIEVRGSWIGQRKAAFLDAVHGALVTALHVPPGDKLVRLVEHREEDFLIPDGMGERFTRIAIELFEGRSLDAKRALYREIVRRLEPFGVPPQDVKILLLEMPQANVGFRGGKAACDVDLGYATAV